MSMWIDPDNRDHEVDSEKIFLGGILRDNNLIETDLQPSDFKHPLLGMTFELMQQLHAERQPIDAITLSSLSPTHTTLFWELTDEMGFAGDFHGERVRDNATRRKLRSAADDVVRVSADGSMSIDEVTDRARALIEKASGIRAAKAETSMQVAERVVANIGRATPATPTPWAELNKVIRGLRPGALYVIAARPRIGKSALALQIAAELEKHGSVGFFSLEMGSDEIVQRLIAQQAWVPLPEIDGQTPMSPLSRTKVQEWLAHHSGQILFDDSGMTNVSQLRAKVRSWARDHDLQGIVLDYIQLVSGPSGASKIEVVTEVTRQLKLIAMEFQIPVIALSQLNRNAEGRTDKRPALGDMRESGSIEQDADVVMLLHNDDKANLRDSNPQGEELEVIVAKNRQGETRSVHLTWHGEFVSALDAAGSW